ncbi:mechanosensitive ion channel family protein [Aquibium carbonis]|uniref:Mechanosensitive ion channel family protein n=1 Tax=Aquibium carbonis TaxID=2495581 RepID=A0A429Z106_9HYPH|nr:mechanosensitive ion channel domain-containing protein [Aquibium carbonis]RST87402.1 mechanosensitive ion channel family protein [Aquibium carbonis]
MSVVNSLYFAPLFLSGSMGMVGGAFAQENPSAEVPPKVQELLQILQDKDVRDWLVAIDVSPSPEATATNVGVETIFSDRIGAIREHLVLLVQAIPRIPEELSASMARVRDASAGFGFAWLLLFAAVLIIAGVVAQYLVRARFRSTDPSEAPASHTVQTRLRRIGRSVAREAGATGAFALASIGPFLLVAWPDLPRAIVMTLLTASLTFMVVRGLAIVLLAPTSVPGASMPPALRVVPVSDRLANHFFLYLVMATGWLAFGSAFVRAVRLAEIDGNVALFLAYALGLGLALIGILMVWLRPVGVSTLSADTFIEGRKSHFSTWFLTLHICLLWVLWVAGATPLFWLIAFAGALPIAILVAQRAVYSLFLTDAEESASRVPGKMAVIVETAIRTLLIAGAIVLLARAWNVRLGDLAGSDDPLLALMRSLLIVLVILLVIDVIWRVTRSIIDESIERARIDDLPGSPLSIRRAKLRTLLPIVRNVTMIFLATLAVLMSLATVGVEIAPLVASAGVVGVAIGFGAQTVVKDVISGMFYLLDDAFRVGEYIVSGNFRGTVESFSLRSVRLRHHRGPVYTIPFGVLGAVQNLSRDYVVDKMLLTVTYDTDIEKARRLLKKVGQQLAEDPELSKSIIETLKMQAVGDFEDYGIQIKLKMTTKPGEQYIVRKKAYPLIKKIFDENGIEFAYPTIKVIGGDAADGAAAHEVLKAGTA